MECKPMDPGEVSCHHSLDRCCSGTWCGCSEKARIGDSLDDYACAVRKTNRYRHDRDRKIRAFSRWALRIIAKEPTMSEFYWFLIETNEYVLSAFFLAVTITCSFESFFSKNDMIFLSLALSNFRTVPSSW